MNCGLKSRLPLSQARGQEFGVQENKGIGVHLDLYQFFSSELRIKAIRHTYGCCHIGLSVAERFIH